MFSDEGKANKKLWSVLSGWKKDTAGVPPLKKDSITFTDSNARANILNDQFASIFTSELNSPLPTNTLPTFSTMPKITIGVKSVAKLLWSTKLHKATGPDFVPVRILKEVAKELAPVLALLFQSSLDKGTVHDDWKRVNVVPVFKKGDRSTPLNYRSISLITICSKLMEHIIHSNIMKHLHFHNILTDNQHGFRKWWSFESQLIIAIGDLANALNNKEQVDVILLDFAKAFDKVPQRRLLQKVEKCGVRGNILKWILPPKQNSTGGTRRSNISSHECSFWNSTRHSTWTSAAPHLHQRPPVQCQVNRKAVCRWYHHILEGADRDRCRHPPRRPGWPTEMGEYMADEIQRWEV